MSTVWMLRLPVWMSLLTLSLIMGGLALAMAVAAPGQLSWVFQGWWFSAKWLIVVAVVIEVMRWCFWAVRAQLTASRSSAALSSSGWVR